MATISNFRPINKRISFKQFFESMKIILVALVILMLMGPVYGQQTAEYWYNKGNALYNESMFDKAIKAYDEAIRLNPNYAEAWSYKGYALDSQGKHDEAIRAYDGAIRACDKAIQLDPNDYMAWCDKGFLLYNQKKYTEAIEAFDNALVVSNNVGLNLTRAGAWFGKGLAFYAQKKYDDAIEAYDEAVRLYPKHARAWFGKGQALYEQKKYVGAIEAFNETVKVDPLYVEAWHNMTQALREIGKSDQARQTEVEESKASWDCVAETMEQRARERKKSLLEAFNASGAKITSDPHGYSNVVAPMGPYQLSFSIRTIYDYMQVTNSTFSRTVGFSKTYHIENFTTDEFVMFDGDDEYGSHTIADHALVVKIARYTGPAKYTPEDPDPLGYDELPQSWNVQSPRDITIDGHRGSWITADASTTHAKKRPDIHILAYSMNSTTFVTIKSNMDWDKDVALVIETMQITEKKA